MAVKSALQTVKCSPLVGFIMASEQKWALRRSQTRKHQTQRKVSEQLMSQGREAGDVHSVGITDFYNEILSLSV